MSSINRIRRIIEACAVWIKQKQAPLKPSDYHRPILSMTDGNAILKSSLESGEPFMASRIGAFELCCLQQYNGGRRRNKPYSRGVATGLGTCAGFFPLTEESLDEFCSIYLDAITQTDAMGVWYNAYENRVIMEYCPDATLVPLESLEPYYHTKPWSKAIQGKRVLVVHPFAESIREQYENNRVALFKNVDVLPEFRLHTLKAVQSIAGEHTGFATWFEALDSMKSAMDSINYDVCIIGAGAYGLPLAAHAKRSGKQAVHMGGAVQILFGIKGRRWDEDEIISSFYNGTWVRPKESETPHAYFTVEDGCYW